ncbi:MAG: nucleotidyltransferase family protein [Candidatus Aminicenantes bacterium]|nr:nucleotidyltransferase family protein [Candidatus Aminicenantes bacterium]
MKVVLLAAGRGTRLKPWTDAQPKVLIPVAGKAPLERHLEHLRAAGIEDVFINLHHRPDLIRGRVGDGSRWGLRVRYAFEPELLGTAGAVKNLERDLSGEPFLVVYADNTVEADYADLVRFAADRDALGVIAVVEKDDVSGSGILDIGPQGRIARFLEKPEPAAAFSRWVNAGIYHFRPRLFEYLEPGFADFGRDVFPLLLERGEPLLAYVLKGPVVAVDTPDLLRTATRAGRESP